MKPSFDHSGGGIVIDLGTGDGRFVSAMARAHPDKFFIGIDANVKPLEKPSMRATRKPSKGGLANLMFVQAAVEDLPEEFDGVADEIHVHFPWGSLLGAVALGDEAVLRTIRRIAAPECVLEVMIGIDPVQDRTEIARLGIPDLSQTYLNNHLVPCYERAGFAVLEIGQLEHKDWARLETSWARRLKVNPGRSVTSLLFKAVDG